MKKKIRTYIIIIIFTALAFIQLRSCNLNDEIKKYGSDIVVKFTTKNVLPKKTTFYFTYFINGKKIITANSGIRYSILNSDEETKIIDNLEINSFYLAKYVTYQKDKIIVDATKKVTDTVVILKAGFSRDDIINYPSCAKSSN
jgi:hypothetical protein